MAGFSSVTLTGNYGAGTTGTLTFLLTMAMANNNVIALPQPIVITLSAAGTFSQAFNANTDPTSYPSGTWYAITENIDGFPSRDYAIQIPYIQVETNATVKDGSDVIQLSTATASTNMIGQSITGTGIPANTIITGANPPQPVGELGDYLPTSPNYNTITISNNATAAGTGVTLTMGETIDISWLMPAVLPWT